MSQMHFLGACDTHLQKAWIEPSQHLGLLLDQIPSQWCVSVLSIKWKWQEVNFCIVPQLESSLLQMPQIVPGMEGTNIQTADKEVVKVAKSLFFKWNHILCYGLYLGTMKYKLKEGQLAACDALPENKKCFYILQVMYFLHCCKVI